MTNSIEMFRSKKSKLEKITMLTCYDYSMARLIDKTNLDAILVGDSLGMVIQGNDNTLSVTVDDIVYHTKAVRKGSSKFIVSDMPFLSYHTTSKDAVLNAGRIISEGGASAVKVEGGIEIAENIKKIIAAKIPVMGHLGLTPQSVNMFGGYKVQGKSVDSAAQILKDALMLEELGVFCIVLEAVPLKLAKIITEKLTIPVIGIGCGNVTDGQVLVVNDMLGMFDDFIPKFVKRFANLSTSVVESVNNYIQDVANGSFPGEEHSFNISDEIVNEIKNI